jgi:hypothetical protein
VGASDLLITAAILSAAGWILYRSLWKARGRCCGCSGCGSAPGGDAPVRLGRRRD